MCCSRFVVVGFDTTVWPANATVVMQATSTMSQLLTMSNSNVAFVQFPVHQSQTNPSAVLKHKHLLESSFLKASMTLNNTVQVLFSKPGSRSSDGRQLSQTCLAVFHSNFSEVAWTDSRGIRDGFIGPCPLVRISDMQGFDPDSKLGASARTEQIFGSISVLAVLSTYVNLPESSCQCVHSCLNPGKALIAANISLMDCLTACPLQIQTVFFGSMSSQTSSAFAIKHMDWQLLCTLIVLFEHAGL